MRLGAVRELTPEQLDSDIEELRGAVAAGTSSQAALDRLLSLREDLSGLSEADWETYRFLGTHLPDGAADVSTIVIKGHLLLEHLVDGFIDSRLQNPHALRDTRLTAYQKLCIAEAFCLPNEEPAWLWARVKELNTIRNKFAHTLEPHQLEERIEALVLEIHTRSPLSQPDIRLAICRLYGMLNGLLDVSVDPEFRVKPFEADDDDAT